MFWNPDLSDLTLQTYTQKDEHAPKGQEEPSPGQSEYNERHPGYRATHIPCALNRRSPAEGKGKVAAGNIGGFIRIYISNVSSCPCYRLFISVQISKIRIHSFSRCHVLGIRIHLILQIYDEDLYVVGHARPEDCLYQFKSVKSGFNFSPEDMISRIRIYLILRILPCGRNKHRWTCTPRRAAGS